MGGNKMGCDIHPYLEVVHNNRKMADGKPYVESYSATLNRDYCLFSLMAGVRGSGNEVCVSEPKGLPENLGYCANSDNHLDVVDEDVSEEGICSRTKAEEWVSLGYSTWRDEKQRDVTNPDWHSHSWLSLEELEKVQKLYSNVNQSPNIQLAVIIASMKTIIELSPPNSVIPRLVFWFDN